MNPASTSPWQGYREKSSFSIFNVMHQFLEKLLHPVSVISPDTRKRTQWSNGQRRAALLSQTRMKRGRARKGSSATYFNLLFSRGVFFRTADCVCCGPAADGFRTRAESDCPVDGGDGSKTSEDFASRGWEEELDCGSQFPASPREIAFPSRVHLANLASFRLNKPRPSRSCPPSTPVRVALWPFARRLPILREP